MAASKDVMLVATMAASRVDAKAEAMASYSVAMKGIA